MQSLTIAIDEKNVDEVIDFHLQYGLKHFEDKEFVRKQMEEELDKPCGMDFINLMYNYSKFTYRKLSVKGLTNRQVIEKILVFYRHKTIRRCMGNHIFLEGWFVSVKDLNDGEWIACLYGS
jgi:hypothetical protein